MPQKCATILEWEWEVSTNNVLTEQALSFLVVVGTTLPVFNINHHGYVIHLLFFETIPSLSICSLLAKCMTFFSSLPAFHLLFRHFLKKKNTYFCVTIMSIFQSNFKANLFKEFCAFPLPSPLFNNSSNKENFSFYFYFVLLLKEGGCTRSRLALNYIAMEDDVELLTSLPLCPGC